MTACSFLVLLGISVYFSLGIPLSCVFALCWSS